LPLISLSDSHYADAIDAFRHFDTLSIDASPPITILFMLATCYAVIDADAMPFADTIAELR